MTDLQLAWIEVVKWRQTGWVLPYREALAEYERIKNLTPVEGEQ
jgi:hypothetical protein